MTDTDSYAGDHWDTLSECPEQYCNHGRTDVVTIDEMIVACLKATEEMWQTETDNDRKRCFLLIHDGITLIQTMLNERTSQ